MIQENIENQNIITVSDGATRFLRDIARGSSPATRNTYRVALNGFLRYMQDEYELNPHVVPLEELKTDWAIGYLRFRADGEEPQPLSSTSAKTVPEPPAARATLATYAAALGRFYKWCSIEKLVSLPAEEYERMQIRFKELKGKERRSILSKVPPDEIVEALIREARKPRSSSTSPSGELDKARQQLIWLRDIAILETLRCTGARVSEVTSLTRGDLDNTNRRALTVGKGNKERWLYFNTASWEAIEKYLAERARMMSIFAAGNQTNPEQVVSSKPRRGAGRANFAAQPLFARHDRGAGLSTVQPLTPRTIQKMVLELAEKASLDSNITPHKFRHWVATRLLAATGDLAATQDLLGHASPTTTRIYAQVNEQTRQNLHRQVFD
ncbi:MAG TPA: tyrosine-type recombinase/integrase [Chloroflexia bacterium]|nr:tyrosine-type recombinase/integrase [Chloroflexia bacterium]